MTKATTEKRTTRLSVKTSSLTSKKPLAPKKLKISKKKVMEMVKASRAKLPSAKRASKT